MEQIIKYVIIAIAAIINLIIAVNTSITALKKNKIDPLTNILLNIPEFIDIAEKMNFKDGTAKKNYVLNLCYTRLKTTLKMSYEEVEKEFKEPLSNFIEAVGRTAHFKQKGE